MKCTCNKHLRPEDVPHGVCFNCRVRSIGFTYSGGGTYGKASFNDMTVAERRADIIGDRVLGVDVEPSATFGR